jgi:hypothetical protein
VITSSYRDGPGTTKEIDMTSKCGETFTYRGIPAKCTLQPGHIGSTNGEHFAPPKADEKFGVGRRRAQRAATGSVFGVRKPHDI